ncbi:hypothetical protein [Halovivax sp.]|uniref:hypothetical protein n=1 Tax=Halovivax sp. TaxID=1935978 RepID=UPI0025B821B2|nr:hypothetical protein [Halovivax sp.]
MTDDEGAEPTSDDGDRDGTDETAGSNDLDVPETPPDPKSTDHVLPTDQLVYPTLAFDSGTVSPEGFDCRRELDADAMADWLEGLAGALISHDLAVEGADNRAYLGIAPSAVDLTFDPDDDHRGTIELTVSLDAKVMRYEDADARPTGARGGRGFVPIEMLTGDRPPESFRCYNWIEDPAAGVPARERGTDGDRAGGDETG